MQKHLKKVREQLKAYDQRAYRRRVMWLDLEDRLRLVFEEIGPDGRATDELGRLHFSTSRDSYDEKSSRVNTMNQAQISAGWRCLGFMHRLSVEAEKPSKLAMEQGAALVFSQVVNGSINITLYPYKSDLAKVKEDNIFLAIGLEPYALTETKIRAYIVKLLKYCVASSAMSVGSYQCGLYRLRLRISDYRYRAILKTGFLPVLEKTLALTFAAGSLVAAFMALK